MASINGLFIDGMGHTREMVVEEKSHCINFPIASPLSLSVVQSKLQMTVRPHFHTASFVRLGTLPDGRVVFTQQEARLKLWHFDIRVSDVEQRRCPFDIAESELQEWMTTCGRPVACLYRTATPESPWITHHHFEGIGRQIV